MKDSKKLLLVEGSFDCYAILTGYNASSGGVDLNDKIKIVDCKGVEKLVPNVGKYLKNPLAYTAIWIVLDADANMQGAFDSIWHVLKATELYKDEKPEIIANTGLVISPESDGPTVGVWVMPNNDEPGMIEDFLLQAAADQEMLQESDQALKNLEEKKLNRYKEVHRPKAWYHTYLSWQEEPHSSLTAAFRQGVFTVDDPLHKAFNAWIDELVNL